MAAVYRYWSALVVLLVLVQISLAGFGAFGTAKDTDEGTVDSERFEELFGPHIGLGYLVVLSFLVLLVLAALAKVGRQRLVWSAILFGLGILQVLLAWFGFEVPAIGALHALNAVILAGLAGRIAYANFRGDATLDRGAAAV